MSAVLLFSTSDKVTPDIVEELNKSCWTQFEPVFANSFNPARNEAADVAEPSESATDFTIDTFNGKSVDELQEFFKSSYRDALPENGFTAHSTFAVLDEDGVEDKTITICYESPDLDDEGDEVGPPYWISWRVQWSTAFDVTSQLEGESMEVVETVLIENKDEFTDEDGIFDYQKALEELGYK